MYDIITQIISHTWQSNYSGDQSYIYYIAGALIVVLTVAFVDLVKTTFQQFLRKSEGRI